jgi:hypothetical protein
MFELKRQKSFMRRLPMTDNISTSTDRDRAASRMPPVLLIGIRELRRQLGNLGKTATYQFIARHQIPIIRVGHRSMVAMTNVEDAIKQLATAATSTNTGQRAKELAARSLAVRRARRGSRPT